MKRREVAALDLMRGAMDAAAALRAGDDPEPELWALAETTFDVLDWAAVDRSRMPEGRPPKPATPAAAPAATPPRTAPPAAPTVIAGRELPPGTPVARPTEAMPGRIIHDLAEINPGRHPHRR